MKSYIEQAISAIEEEKKQALYEIETRVKREKILPYNAEIDSMRDKDITALAEALNKAICELQETFTIKKQDIIDDAEKKKADNANSVISAETCIVATKYDTVINKLKEQAGAIEE